MLLRTTYQSSWYMSFSSLAGPALACTIYARQGLLLLYTCLPVGKAAQETYLSSPVAGPMSFVVVLTDEEPLGMSQRLFARDTAVIRRT